MDGCLLTALSVWEFCALAAQKQFALEPQLSNWPLVTSRFLTPFFLLPEPAVIISSNLAGETAALPQGSRHGQRSPQPPKPFQQRPTTLGRPHLAPAPALTCRASLIHPHAAPTSAAALGSTTSIAHLFSPQGLLKARCSLCHPSEHSGA